MSDYLPLYKPGQSITRATSADVTGGQLVAVSGDGTVAPAAANSTKWVGVAAFDAKSGDNVTVHCGGVQRLVASGAVTAGDTVAAAAAGKVATSAAPTVGQPVGTALSTAATGKLVEIQMAH